MKVDLQYFREDFMMGTDFSLSYMTRATGGLYLIGIIQILLGVVFSVTTLRVDVEMPF